MLTYHEMNLPYFEITVLVKEDIARLEISVNDAG